MFFTRIRIALSGLLLIAAACGVSQSRSTATPVPSPQVTPPPTFTASPLPVSPSPSPTLPPAPRAFSESFDQQPAYWTYLAVDNGQPFTGPIIRDGFLAFDLTAPNQWAYAFYAVDYTDALVETDIQFRAPLDGAAGLVCRYDPQKGWYEFTIHPDQSYQLLFGQWLATGIARYSPLVEATSEKISADANHMGLLCQGDLLIPFINGVQMRRWQERIYGLARGQAGLSAASFGDVPLTIAFDSVKVGEP